MEKEITAITDHSALIEAIRAREEETFAMPVRNSSLLRVYPVSQWLQAAKSLAEPRELWLKTWYEGEVCCLFADSNLGKSIYAVQIGLTVARMGKRVLYCDFELSEKQFQLRYTDEQGGLLPVPENFYRADLNPDAELREGDTFDKAILQSIEEAANFYEADTVIVDNITYLSMLTESGDMAAELMVNLMRLKKVYGWSLLILAHTPKRMPDQPLTPNDLAGSKKLFNFFDCVLAMGKSLNDEDLRYVKQLKVRHGAFTYDSSNVVLYEIDKDGSMLHFVPRGFSRESALLTTTQRGLTGSQMKQIEKLHSQGMSIRKIAEALGMGKTRIGEYIKRLTADKECPKNQNADSLRTAPGQS